MPELPGPSHENMTQPTDLSEGELGHAAASENEAIEPTSPQLSKEQFDVFVSEYAELGSAIDDEEARYAALKELAETKYGIHSLEDVSAIAHQFASMHELPEYNMTLTDSGRTIPYFRAEGDNPFSAHRQLFDSLDSAFDPSQYPSEEADDSPIEFAELPGARVDAPETLPAEPPVTPHPEATTAEQDAEDLHQVQLENYKSGELHRWVNQELDSIEATTDVQERGQKMIALKEAFRAKTAHIKLEDGLDRQLNDMRGWLSIEPSTHEEKPAVPEQRPVDEALADFRRETVEKQVPLTQKMRELWARRTTKSLEDINGVDELKGSEKNPYGPDSLREVRAQLAAMRAFERRTAIRKVSPEEMATVEEEYSKALAESIIVQLRQEKITGNLNQEQLRQRAVEMLLIDQKARSELEIAALEQHGGKGVTAMNWLRNHPKSRVAIGLALGGASIVLAASSAGMPALAVGVARAGMRGVGGSETAQGIQGKFGSRRAHSGRQKISERNLGSVDKDNIPALDERTQRLANLLASSAAEGRNSKNEAKDVETAKQLFDAQNKDYLDSLKATERTHTGINFLKGVDGAVEIFIQEQMEAEKARLSSDKIVGQKRFKRAVAVGAVLAIAPVIGSAIEHASSHGGGGRGVGTGSTGSPEAQTGPQAGGVEVPNGGGGSSEVRPGDFADRDVRVKSGDSQWHIAHKLLSYHRSTFGGMNPQEKLVAVDRLKDLMGADNTINPGDHIKVTGAMIKDALNYKN